MLLSPAAISPSHPGVVFGTDRSGGDFMQGVIWSENTRLALVGPVGANGHGRPAVDLFGNPDGSATFKLFNDKDVNGAYGITSAPSERAKVDIDVGRQDATTWDNSGIVVHGSAYRNGITIHAGNVAPVLKVYADAEVLQARNNPDTGFVPLRASEFQVWSTRASKKSVRDLERAGEKVARLHPVRFKRPAGPRVDGSSPEGPDRRNGEADKLGLIAEDVAEVMPEAVVWGADGQPEALDYAAIVAALLKAHQELAEEVARLRGSR